MTLLHICDYGSGNIHNVERALTRAGAQVLRCGSPAELAGARALVIPGVGAFGDCITALRAKGFTSLLEPGDGYVGGETFFSNLDDPPPAPLVFVDERETQQIQQATKEQTDAFKKAFSVCLESKKYMVKY